MRAIIGSQIPFVPASHEDHSRPGVLKRVLLTKPDLSPGRVQMVNWALLPVGSAFTRHYHEDMEEVFVITKGKAAMRCGAEEQSLEAGDCIVVGKREPHEMRNTGDVDVEYVVFGVSAEQGGRTIVCG